MPRPFCQPDLSRTGTGCIFGEKSYILKKMKREILEKFLRKRQKDQKTIEVFINSEKDLYDHFSYMKSSRRDDKAKISEGLIKYLSAEAGKIQLKNPLKIIIRVPENLVSKTNPVRKLINASINEKLHKINKKVKRTNIFTFILALLGLLFIGSTQIIHLLERFYSLQEFVIVMSWVFMWKAVELFFFERIKIMRKKKILMQIYFAQIAIVPAE